MTDKNLSEIRKMIDLVDYEIMKLINRRMELSMRSRKLKGAITDPGREEEVLSHVERLSRTLVTPEFSRRLYSEIMTESKTMQEKGFRIIGFQGEHGAYSEEAALTFNNDLVPIPCVEFAEVFEAISNKELDLGIVPLENSLEGAITPVLDLLLDTDLMIVGEVRLPINHCLLTLPETNAYDIKIVASHPQALAQCRAFIAKHKFQVHPTYDTAGAARALSEKRYPSAGVLASALCAELYDLEIIKEDVADHPSNTTRFVVLARETTTDKGNKCSVSFSAPHKAGTLFHILKIFSDAGINLTRIESRPIRDDSSQYAFLLDFEGNIDDEPVKASLEQLQKIAITFRLLGCYKGAVL